LEAHELRYFQVGVLLFFILFLNLICDDGEVAGKTVMLVPSLIRISSDLISVRVHFVLHFKRLVEVTLFDIVALGIFMKLRAKLKHSTVDYDIAFEKSHEFLKFQRKQSVRVVDYLVAELYQFDDERQYLEINVLVLSGSIQFRNGYFLLLYSHLSLPLLTIACWQTFSKQIDGQLYQVSHL